MAKNISEQKIYCPKFPRIVVKWDCYSLTPKIQVKLLTHGLLGTAVKLKYYNSTHLELKFLVRELLREK